MCALQARHPEMLGPHMRLSVDEALPLSLICKPSIRRSPAEALYDPMFIRLPADL